MEETKPVLLATASSATRLDIGIPGYGCRYMSEVKVEPGVCHPAHFD